MRLFPMKKREILGCEQPTRGIITIQRYILRKLADSNFSQFFKLVISLYLYAQTPVTTAEWAPQQGRDQGPPEDQSLCLVVVAVGEVAEVA
jgi:hypothetical protein